jgi:hypothetical protein
MNVAVLQNRTFQPELLHLLRQALQRSLPNLTRTETGLESPLDSRYGDLVIKMDWDADAESMRVYVRLPNPPGAGPRFLAWCLAVNTLYWDVKLGLDGEGMLLICADVDCCRELDTGYCARVLLERVSAICELVDDDLVPYLRRNRLATPAQLERWRT